MSELIRKNTNSEGELVSLFVQKDSGRTTSVNASPENVIKYCTDVMSVFEPDGTAEFDNLTVEKVDDKVFKIDKKGVVVRNMPSEAGDVLNALRTAVEDGRAGELHRLWGEINERQVDRESLNELIGSIIPSDRVSVSNTGWEIETKSGVRVILTWENKIYHSNQDRNTAYKRSGGGVKALEGGSEFLELDIGKDLARKSIELSDGTELTLDSDDMEFLTKAKWLLTAESQYEDEQFWDFICRYQRGETG